MDAPQTSLAGSTAANKARLKSLLHHMERLNDRLGEASLERDGQWWDTLTSEFFDWSASIYLEDEEFNSYKICRTSIPGYFRSFFEDGAVLLYFIFCVPKVRYIKSVDAIRLTSQDASMVVHYKTPLSTEVVNTDVQPEIYFSYDALTKIKAWHFKIKPSSKLGLSEGFQVPVFVPDDITKYGMRSSTIKYLKQCLFAQKQEKSEMGTKRKVQNIKPPDSTAVAEKKIRKIGEKRKVIDKEGVGSDLGGLEAEEPQEKPLDLSPRTSSPALHSPRGIVMQRWQQHWVTMPQPPPSQRATPRPGTSGQSILTTIQPGSAPPHPTMWDIRDMDEA